MHIAHVGRKQFVHVTASQGYEEIGEFPNFVLGVGIIGTLLRLEQVPQHLVQLFHDLERGEHAVPELRAFSPARPGEQSLRDDLSRAVRDLTAGRGADYVFVTVGSPAAVSQAFGLVRRGGTVVLVGMPAAGATAPVPIGDFAGGNLRLLGSNMGSTRLGVDVPRLVARYRERRLQLDELITARYPLERINEAIAAMEGGGALRNVIVFPAADAA